MAKLSEFQRLSGLGVYLPTLEEARAESNRDVGDVPIDLLGTSERCLEIAEVAPERKKPA